MSTAQRRIREAEKLRNELLKSKIEGQKVEDAQGGTEAEAVAQDAAAETKVEKEPTEQATEDRPVLEVDWRARARELKDEKLKLEHSRDTLRGKYNAETKRLREEVEKLKALVNNQGTEVNPDSLETITETLGIDQEEAKKLLKVLAPAPQQTSNPAVEDSFDPEPAEPAESEPAGLSRSDFFSALDTRLPDWDIVQDTPEFISWARSRRDPMSGRTMYAIMMDADQKNDPDPIVNILSTFVSEDAEEQKRAASNKPAVDVDPVPESAGGQRPSTTQTKTFSRKDAASWPQLLRQGKLSAAEFSTLISEFSQAVKDGRVTD